MQTYRVGPGEAYTTIASALAVIAGLTQPLTEAQEVEVLAGTAAVALTIPPAIVPTASFPLNLENVDFNRPRLLSADLRGTPHVRLSGFDVQGDIQCGDNGQMVSENIIRGSLLAQGDGATSTTFRAYNNSVHNFDGRGIRVKNLRGTIRVMWNSVLSLGAVIDPCYGIEVDESDALVKFNIVQANGLDSLTRAMRLKNTTGRTVTIDRNLYWLKDEASFGELVSGSGTTSCATFAAWKTATGKDASSTFADPLFGCDGYDEAANLEIATESPAIAAGDWDADVQLDIDKTRRPKLMGDPTHSTTLGAFEGAQVITEAGKARILDLIAGLSRDPVTLVAVGDKGTISDAEYLQPTTPSRIATDVTERIFVMKIQAPPPYRARQVVGTTIFFDCFVGPTPGIETLLDGVMNTLSEVGLLTTDGVLFLLRTLQRTPFDPLGRVTTRIRFGIAVGEDICDSLAAALQLTAE